MTMRRTNLKLKYYLPPLPHAYGNFWPLSLAHPQVIVSLQLPMQLHPGPLDGTFMVLAI